MLDDSGQLTQVRSNADPPGSVAKRLGLGKSAGPYKEEGADEWVSSLSEPLGSGSGEGFSAWQPASHPQQQRTPKASQPQEAEQRAALPR